MKKTNNMKTLAGVMSAAALSVGGAGVAHFAGVYTQDQAQADKTDAVAAKNALTSPQHIKELRDNAYMECYNSAVRIKPDTQSYKIGLSIPACMIGQPDARMVDAKVDGLNKEAILTATVSSAYLTARVSTAFSMESQKADETIQAAEKKSELGAMVDTSKFLFLGLGILGVGASCASQYGSYRRRREESGAKPAMA